MRAVHEDHDRQALVDEGGGGEIPVKAYRLKLVRFGTVNFHDYVAYAKVAAVLVAWLALPAGARAGDAAGSALPSVEEVLAHVKAAKGTAPPAYREIDDVVRGGVAEHVTLVRSGNDYRETYESRAILTANGSYHGQAWRQNANGQTILEQPEPGLATRERFDRSIARIAQPVDGFVIVEVNPRGYGTKRYVEAATWHVVRLERVTAAATTVTTYDDFRTIGGYTLPFHSVSRDGHPENDRDERTTSFEPLAAAAADVTIPPPRRALVPFPAGVTTVRLPARLIDGRFIVRVNVGGRGLDFELDSGASGISVEDGVLQSLGITPFGAFSNGVNAGRFRQSTAIVPEMDVGAFTLRDVVVSTLPTIDTGGRLADVRVVGLLGFDFIAELALELDYANGIVTAFDPATFVAPAATAGGFVADIRVGNGQPMTTLTINGAVGERFVIDTGAAGGLLAFDYFARRHPEALSDERGGAVRSLRMSGVGGDFDVRPYVIKKVQLGNVVFEDTQVLVSGANAFGGDQDGLIGQDFLEIFDVYLDYGDSKAYFVFNRTGNAIKRPTR